MTRVMHDGTEDQRGPSQKGPDHEASDASPRRVVMAIGLAMAVMIVGLAFAAVLLWQLNRRAAPSAAAEAHANVVPPPPHLLANPVGERQRLEARAIRNLQQGPVQIDQAMRDVVAQGWDDTDGNAQ